jgi:hypothetical protein
MDVGEKDAADVSSEAGVRWRLRRQRRFPVWGPAQACRQGVTQRCRTRDGWVTPGRAGDWHNPGIVIASPGRYLP